MAIDWNEIYKQKWQQLQGAFKQRQNSINKSKSSELAQLNSMLAQNRKLLANQRDTAMRDAYIAKMNAYKELPETLSKAGFNGGITESAAADILRTYQAARGSANQAFAQGGEKLNSEYGKDKTTLDNKYTALLRELSQQQDQDVLEQAKMVYNAALDEQNRQLEEQKRQLEEKKRQLEEQKRQDQLARDAEDRRRWEIERADRLQREQRQEREEPKQSSGRGSSGSKKKKTQPAITLPKRVLKPINRYIPLKSLKPLRPGRI